MNLQNRFTWEEFIDRFLKNHEEFRFFYGEKVIDISYVSDTSTALSYGNKKVGFLWKDYNSPWAFLEDPVFDGKCLMDIWDDLQ